MSRQGFCDAEFQRGDDISRRSNGGGRQLGECRRSDIRIFIDQIRRGIVDPFDSLR